MQRTCCGIVETREHSTTTSSECVQLRVSPQPSCAHSLRTVSCPLQPNPPSQLGPGSGAKAGAALAMPPVAAGPGPPLWPADEGSPPSHWAADEGGPPDRMAAALAVTFAGAGGGGGTPAGDES